jgi:rRNA-processing protein FCF1
VSEATVCICDANVLIDFIEADEDILHELTLYWTKVYVPTRVLHEVKELSPERAEALGLHIIETPIELVASAGLSGPDCACLHFVLTEGWTCITNDKLLRRACQREGGTVVWGLEMLLILVKAGQITAARAGGVAEKVSVLNPEITPFILDTFKKLLLSL